jgi:hypothetical protein
VSKPESASWLMVELGSSDPKTNVDDDGVLTVFYWQDEPDYEDAWWWDDDYEPTEDSAAGSP